MAAPVRPKAAVAPRVRSLTVGVLACSAAALCACGSGPGESAAARRAQAEREARETSPQPRSACPATVLHTFAQIAKHVYHEGISSERTRAAFRIVGGSAALRQAIERGDATAVQAQARALIATGRITNLRVVRGAGEGGSEAAGGEGEAPGGEREAAGGERGVAGGEREAAGGERKAAGTGQVLADAGGPALAPLRGTIKGARGSPIATFVTSVWSDEGIVAETNGIAQSYTVLRARGRQIAGSLPVPPGRLPPKGSLSIGGVRYRYSSIAVRRYPAGAARIYLFRPASSFAALCGATPRDTVVNTLQSVARVIYAGETGSRARAQVRRVEADPALLRAVAARDREAARVAIDNLLTEHIVRLRVFAGGQLLMDVGGPYVLGPVGGVLNAGGRQIGTFVLSIQDDEGYLRLARRLGGMYVLMYMGTTLVKNSLGPSPGSVPENGLYTYRGRRFRTFTLTASAFPSGPLHIRVLVPLPYT